MAAIVKFHEYMHAKGPRYVESDHCLLKIFFKKPLSQTPPRIQLVMLKVQKYNLRVHCKSVREHHIADTLSRVCISQNENYIRDFDYSVFSVDTLPLSQVNLSEIREQTT